MEFTRFRRQFILTQQSYFADTWQTVKIFDYFLHLHPELDYVYCRKNEVEIHALGVLYDSEEPVCSNSQIVERLVAQTTLDDCIRLISKISGQFVIIYKDAQRLIMLNDTCGQREIYYDTQFKAFGSQPKILAKVIDVMLDTGENIQEFLSSKNFCHERYFVGEITHLLNVKHLLPNHYIDIREKKVIRFFPTQPIVEISIEQAAHKASQMLAGYIKAAALREDIALAVTAGYDSRVLFLTSLGLDCTYYVSQHSWMKDTHPDLVIPQILATRHDKDFIVVPDECDDGHYREVLDHSVDFPRYLPLLQKPFGDCVYINGNISEVARNYFGYHNKLSPESIAFLYHYNKNKLAIEEYRNWLDNSYDRVQDLGYHYLDILHWESKMGGWAAKAKTECNAVGKTLSSPYNSRELLITLLSTKRKYRDVHNNELYNHILCNLSSKVSDIPINPSYKRRIIGFMKAIQVYNAYSSLKVKLNEVVTW